ncbi:MAG: hypothetical protein J6X49_00320 [Victivallales bacterium]|nr:hypothetical protein [Victivallales bacterium]
MLIIVITTTAIRIHKMLMPLAPPVPPERVKAVEEIAKRFVDELRNHRGNAKSAVVLHLDNDPTHCLTHAIRHRIRETGILALAADSLKERLFTVFNLSFDCCKDEQEALWLAGNAQQDLLIWGAVDLFESDEKGRPIITGKLHVIDAKTLELIFTFPLDDKPELLNMQSSEIAHMQNAGFSLPSRLTSLLLMISFLSLMLFPNIRKLAAKRSNNINLVMLVLLSAIDTALATALIGATGFLPLHWFLPIAALLIVIYNLMLLNHATRLEM